MTTQLHQQIAAIAQNDPAIHVSKLVLINLITNRLDKALNNFVGFYQRYPDINPIVQIGLKSCTYHRAAANWQVNLPPAGAEPGAFNVVSTAAFAAVFAVAKVDDGNVELFTVTLTVDEVNALGFVDRGMLSIKDPVLTSSTLPVEDPNYAVNLLACGLTDAQVKRLEGLVEGSVVPASFNNIFRGAPAINLESLFPMISFQDPTEIDEVAGGLLIVARQGARLNQPACCPCGTEPPAITVQPGQYQPNPDPTTGGTLPINIVIPPPAGQMTENNVDGQLALYLPKVTIQAMSGGPYPAIAGYQDDNGFIGYSADYTVAFLSASLSLTDPRATVVLKVEFYLTGHGDITVDLPCVGRQDIGRFWVTNRNNPIISYVEIGVSPKLLSNGTLVFQEQLLTAFVSFVDVDAITVAQALLVYLGPFGGMYGFILDMVLARIIGQKLDMQLDDSIRDMMGNFNWTIFNISDFDVSILGDQTYRISPAVSRMKDSVLLGFDLDRPFGQGDRL
jgi:hypothetical protein